MLCSKPVAAEEWSASLPLFAACNPSSAPELPKRWRAVGLLAPFRVGQLEVGEFVYDDELPAMRASLYGLEKSAVDLLITETDTYQLIGPHDAPTACVSLGQVFRPPFARWLADDSVCAGESRLNATTVQWWKRPAGDTRANWLWLDRSSRLPWRAVFTSPTATPAVIGAYAMAHFPTFTPVEQTNLSRLREFCVASVKGAPKNQPPSQPAPMVENPAGEAERLARIASLFPGVSYQACSRMKQATWADQFIMTLMLTPIRFKEDPYASLLYYDWRRTKTQQALMFQGSPPEMQGVISLKDGIGYRILRHSSGGYTCEPVYPGIVRPDWTINAWCQCRGVIEGQAAFGATTQILSCPIRGQGDRVMWSWFTEAGRPSLFMEAGAQGGGVMFADYFDWLPGQTVPEDDLKLPEFCPVPDLSKPLGAKHGTIANRTCSDCHTSRD